MKTKFILIAFYVFAVLFVALPQQTRAQYQPPDSCLTLYWLPDSNFVNLDSVKIDTCEQSSTYIQLYAKNPYYVRFKYNVLKREGTFPSDTIIEYTWHDLDSNYNETKLGFEQLEEKYGNFWFKEPSPNLTDTTLVRQRTLYVRFENDLNIDSVENFVENIKYVLSFHYVGIYGINSFTPDTQIDKLISKVNFEIYPNPATEEFRLKFQVPTETTVQLSIFDLLGNMVLSRTEQAGEGTNEKTINCEKLPSGYYYVKINVNENVQTIPLLIIK